MRNGNPDGLAILKGRFPTLPPDTRYVADADEATLRSIDRGALFFMAFWSGTSFQSLRRLLNALSEYAEMKIELVIVDVDGSESLYDLPEFETFPTAFCGNGETAWIRDGGVFATTRGVRENPDPYLRNLRVLESDRR